MHKSDSSTSSAIKVMILPSSIVAFPMFIPFSLYALGNGYPAETFPQSRFQESDSMPSTSNIGDTIPEVDAAANRLLSDSHIPVSHTLDNYRHEVAHFLVQDTPQEISPEYPSNTVPMSSGPGFSAPVMGERSGPILAEPSNSSELLSGRPKSSIDVSMPRIWFVHRAQIDVSYRVKHITKRSGHEILINTFLVALICFLRILIKRKTLSWM